MDVILLTPFSHSQPCSASTCKTSFLLYIHKGILWCPHWMTFHCGCHSHLSLLSCICWLFAQILQCQPQKLHSWENEMPKERSLSDNDVRRQKCSKIWSSTQTGIDCLKAGLSLLLTLSAAVCCFAPTSVLSSWRRACHPSTADSNDCISPAKYGPKTSSRPLSWMHLFQKMGKCDIKYNLQGMFLHVSASVQVHKELKTYGGEVSGSSSLSDQ